MIRLVDILKETLQKPKAIFLAGPAGAGKSFILKSIPILGTFKVINVDDTYEELLKASGLGMKQKDFTSDQLSKAAKLMAQAQKVTTKTYQDTILEKSNLILDGTGASHKVILKKKEELESLGYDTMMLMIWVSPMTSLQRNMERERSLMPAIVLRTWRDINNNIEIYRKAFGNFFILVNNDLKDADISFNSELIKKQFFDTSKAKGKPKTPEEIEKSKANIEKLNNDISLLVKKKPSFDTLDSAKSKIKSFIS